VPYEDRVLRLTQLVPDAGAILLNPGVQPAPNAVFLAPVYVTKQLAAEAWVTLRSANAWLGCEFYEGLVAKRADSLYPIQLRSPDEAFAGWIKHRWQW